MELEEFKQSINDLKSFINELNTLNKALDMISKGSISEIGYKFIDDYIVLLENHVGDDSNWVSWYVFENDFGKKKLSVKIPGKTKKGKFKKMRIKNVKDLYKVIQDHRKYNTVIYE